MDGWCGVEDVQGSCSASASSADWRRLSRAPAVLGGVGATRVDGGRLVCRRGRDLRDGGCGVVDEGCGDVDGGRADHGLRSAIGVRIVQRWGLRAGWSARQR